MPTDWTERQVRAIVGDYFDMLRDEIAGHSLETLKTISARLTGEFGQGYSVDNLQRMRQFYLLWAKYATLSRISEAPTAQRVPAKRGAATSAPPSRKSGGPFRLSWSQTGR